MENATQPRENAEVEVTARNQQDALKPDGEGKRVDTNLDKPPSDSGRGAEPIIETAEKPWSVWKPRQVKMIVMAASFASLLSPLSGQIYFPALNSIAENLHVSDSLVNLSITTYLVRFRPRASWTFLNLHLLGQVG